MSRGDSENAGAYMMGSGWMRDPAGGWSTAAVIGVILGALALSALVAYLLLRHRHGRKRPSQPTTAQSPRDGSNTADAKPRLPDDLGRPT